MSDLDLDAIERDLAQGVFKPLDFKALCAALRAARQQIATLTARVCSAEMAPYLERLTERNCLALRAEQAETNLAAERGRLQRLRELVDKLNFTFTLSRRVDLEVLAALLAETADPQKETP